MQHVGALRLEWASRVKEGVRVTDGSPSLLLLARQHVKLNAHNSLLALEAVC